MLGVRLYAAGNFGRMNSLWQFRTWPRRSLARIRICGLDVSDDRAAGEIPILTPGLIASPKFYGILFRSREFEGTRKTAQKPVAWIDHLHGYCNSL